MTDYLVVGFILGVLFGCLIELARYESRQKRAAEEEYEGLKAALSKYPRRVGLDDFVPLTAERRAMFAKDDHERQG